jgi:DNA integrity scanning protein DisA with diadenylate cyclase activity
MLMSGGFKTIQNLVEADDEALRQVSGLDEGDIEQIRQAVDAFLRSGSARAASPV